MPNDPSMRLFTFSTAWAPFDDSVQVDHRKPVSSSITYTGGFDAYRQGVELTTREHYALGMVKIHVNNGRFDGDHRNKQSDFGQTQTVFLDAPYHEDVLPVQPADYVSGSLSLTEALLDKGTDLDVGLDLFDGVIEPLTIRDVVSLIVTEKSAPHRPWGSLGEGNESGTRVGSDRIWFRARIVDVRVGNRPIVDDIGGSGGLVNPSGILSTDSRTIGPFADDFEVKGVALTSTSDSGVQTAVRAMSPGTENYLPRNYVQLGDTGFTYP